MTEDDTSKVRVIEINDTLVDPYKITQAVRDSVSEGRKTTSVNRHEVGTGSMVVLYSAPDHEKPGLGDKEIPNQTRPHKVFESVQPNEGPIDGKNRV